MNTKSYIGKTLAIAVTGMALVTAQHAIAAGVPGATILETQTTPPASGSGFRIEILGQPRQNGGIGKYHQADSESLVFVRLLRSSDGAPLTNADVTVSRADMSPGGMGDMTARSYVRPYRDLGGHPGVYKVEIHPAMAGQWAVTLAAREAGDVTPAHETMSLYLMK